MESRLSGQVKWYKEDRGYGIIQGDDSIEYFVHHTNVSTQQPLYPGLCVSFFSRPRSRGKRGMEAYDVELSAEVPLPPTHSTDSRSKAKELTSSQALSAGRAPEAPGKLTGFIDHRYPGTDRMRIHAEDGRTFIFSLSGKHGNLAVDQHTLRDFLTHLPARWPLPILPKVSFGTAQNSRLARHVYWLAAEQDTLALPSARGLLFLVLEEEQSPYLALPLDTSSISSLAGQAYQAVEPKGASDTPQVVAIVRNLSHAEELLEDDNRDLQRVLVDHLQHPEASKLVERLASHFKSTLQKDGWSTLEHTIIDRLEPPLAQFFRERLLSSLDRDQLRDAWLHFPNQALLRHLMPDRVQQWLREEALVQILNELKAMAIDVEVRYERIQEIGVCNAKGEIRHWQNDFERAIQDLSEDIDLALLVGHNIAWDLQHLRRIVPDAPLLDLPVVDTLLLAAILNPRSQQTLQLGGQHRAGQDARDTMQLLRQQIIDLAQIPEDLLVHWIDLADEGLRQLLAQTLKNRESLASCPASDVSGRGRPPKGSLLLKEQLPIEAFRDLMEALPDDEHSLVVVPRILLPLCADIDHALILDPHALYIDDPLGERVSQLRIDEETSDVPIGDLLVYASAFARESRIRQQSAHEICMVEWVHIVTRAKGKILSCIGSTYENVRQQLNEIPAKCIIVPVDSLKDQAFWGPLRSRAFDRVILVGPEMASRELEQTFLTQMRLTWQTRMLPFSDGWIVGLSEPDLERLQIAVPSGWQSWLVESVKGDQAIHAVPRNTETYLRSVFPSLPSITLTLGDTGKWIHVCDFGERLWFTPATPYRADYLGQIAGFVLPLAQQKRVLLNLQDQDEAHLLREALQGQGAYLPAGTLLTQMERLAKNGRGLAIAGKDQLIGYALRAQVHNLSPPFDIIITEAWPVDDPRLIPPLTSEELRELREHSPQQEGQAVEDIDEETSLNDDELEQEEDQGQSLSVQDSVPSWADILGRRLREHPNALAVLAWAADRLSEKPLLVLDSRIAAEKVSNVGEYQVNPIRIDYDEEVASRVRQELAAEIGPGLRRHREGNGVPRQEDWNNLARQLFDLPGDLYEWQREYLASIMLQEHRTLTVEASTGSGKSLLFQLPALVQGTHTGLLTLVISPLRALMHEQCQKLWQLGFVFVAEAISSDLSADEVEEVYQRLADGQIRLLFVAPERFRSRRFREALEERLQRDRRLQYWVFDEAHCISLWGHDFRPDYFYAAGESQRLRTTRSEEIAPVILLSATLPDRVIGELEEIFEHGD